MGKTATQVAELAGQIKTATEMPEPKRGRSSLDYTPLIEKLKDFQPHTISNIEDVKVKNRYARWLREAANQAGMDVSEVWRPDLNTLYFRGYKKGEAPPRGRRGSGKTQVSGQKVETTDKKVATAKAS